MHSEINLKLLEYLYEQSWYHTQNIVDEVDAHIWGRFSKHIIRCLELVK
jgi:hypothetical protein